MQALHLILGTIPACAGEPERRPTGIPHPWDYPRVRGGTSGTSTGARWAAGLSPRARGNRVLSGLDGRQQGTIPACAGEPISVVEVVAWLRDYPRVRGGTSDFLCRRACSAGLSPRARGNRGLLGNLLEHTGTIPACAGEPLARFSIIAPSRDYPRVRGGTLRHLLPWLVLRGLSPRARGNPRSTARSLALNGTIPACAGEPYL